MQASAIIVEGPQALVVADLALKAPGPDDLVVDIHHSAISTGTEKLFWSGQMPPFPGMGYPLVPGYEAAGEVVEAPAASGFKPGDWVFVPGADCYAEAFGLFGGASARVVTDPARVSHIDRALGETSSLLALAATARHAMAGPGRALPELIVGHGVLGRLLARLTIAAGGAPPTVWEIDPARRTGAEGYTVLDPDHDERRDYGSIYDASGTDGVLDLLIPRLKKGGEIVLAGFYPNPVSFAFPPAFMKEARVRVAAEWAGEDLVAIRRLTESGTLSLDGLITHRRPASAAAEAYPTAFGDPACLKMVLDWKDAP